MAPEVLVSDRSGHRLSSRSISTLYGYTTTTHHTIPYITQKMLDIIATGVGFGAALVASGMYSPYLIASQFTLQRWNMVQTFLTATGCSA